MFFGLDRRRILVAATALSMIACGPTRPQPLPIGAACTPIEPPGEQSLECANRLCVALDSASGFCTTTCTSDSDCPRTFACDAAGRYGRICKPTTGCRTDATCPAGHVCNINTGNCYIKVSRGLCSACEDLLQCPSGGACFTAVGSGETFCTGPCGADAGCPSGFGCESIAAGQGGAAMQQCVPSSGTCKLGRALCASCAGDFDCGGPYDLCVRNLVSGERFCGHDCAPDAGSACPAGFSCVDLGYSSQPGVPGPWQCVPDSNTCANFCNATDQLGQQRQCGLGKTCSLPSHQCQAASDGRQCSSCASNDACEAGPFPENRCLVNQCSGCPYAGESFCAAPCVDTSACAQTFGVGFICAPVTSSDGGTRSFCVPQRGTCRSGLGQLGDDCSPHGGGDCLAGLCVTQGLVNFCTEPCRQDSDCGDTRWQCCQYDANGYDCSAAARTATGPANGAGLCAPLGGLFGDDCSPGRPPCQNGVCLDLGVATVCTNTCAAGCPSGFSCRPALGGSICFPNGGGAAGSDCRFGPASCASGLCIRKDSGNLCTALCSTAADCPAHWLCSALYTIDGKAVQACLPPALQ